MRILLEGARALVDNRILKRVDIIIDAEKGTIERLCISPPRSSYDIRIKLDRKMIILPGFVDIHVHCRDWGQRHKETIETCSQAAARGGVVKIFDMPNTAPPLNTYERLKERIEYAREKSVVEYYVHGGVPEDLDDLIRYLELGVRSIKIFPEDLKRLEENKCLEKFFRLCEKYDILIVIHCEDIDIIRRNMENIPHITDNHSLIRCRESEISCISYMLSILQKYNVRIHFTHVSTPDSIILIRSLKTRSTLDVTPHHLLLTYDLCKTITGRGEICKVNPPLRDEKDRDRILTLFLRGLVDCIVSDHAPHKLEEKLETYDKCPPGFPGLETTSLILLTMWRLNMLNITDVVKLYCENPCKIVNIRFPIIRESEKANLYIVNTGVKKVIDPEEFVSMAKYSPFKNFKIEVEPVLTLCNGKIVYVNNNYVSI